MAQHRPLRGPRGAEVVAVPDRDERLPRHAQRPPAPRPADGAHGGRQPRRRPAEHAARGHVAGADPRRARHAGLRRPGRDRARPGDPQARLRRRAAAPARPPARGAHPARGAALERGRGRHAARHERRLGQQRAAARPGRDRRDRADPGRRRRSRWTTSRPSCSSATSPPSSSTTWTSSSPCCTRTRRCRCRPSTSGCAAPSTSWRGTSAPATAAAARGSSPTSANGMPAFGQYRPSGPGGSFEPWALQVIEISGGRITGLNAFLDTARWFPLFGLPAVPPERQPV